MQEIWKFVLEVTDHQVVKMPRGARILSLHAQGDEPALWVQVRPDMELVDRTFRIVGTGHPIASYEDRTMNFIGTVVVPPFVWHVFEVNGPPNSMNM